MSTLVISNQENFYKKPSHRKNDSDELDVFEASRYFSTSNEVLIYNDSNSAQKSTREEKQGWRGGRISLDMPVMRTSIPPQSHKKEKKSKEKKDKLPRSPGGKLASFLNSLFNQTPSKKKKPKFMSLSMTDKEESLGGRKRRSSISYFGNTFPKDSKSAYSKTTVSVFNTPPPHVNANTPKKVYYKEWNSSHSDISGHVIKQSSLRNDVNFIEDLKFITNGILEKPMKKNGILEKIKGAKEIQKLEEVDDGGESDSSSDLFELENYDFKYYSSGLPVYETTHMDTVKKGPLNSTGAI